MDALGKLASVDDGTLSRQLSVGWEYAWKHEDWTTPLDQALEGLSADNALIRPLEPGAKGVWEIVLHLAAWNENIVARVASGEAVRPEEGSWPPIPEKPDEAAWEAAKTRLTESFEAVAEMIASTPVERIQAAPYGLEDLLCRFVHAGYHIGQIVKLRECLSLYSQRDPADAQDEA